MTETAALDSIFELANHFELTPPGGHVTTWTAMVEVGSEQRLFDAKTRQAVLDTAAEWCRKELTK